MTTWTIDVGLGRPGYGDLNWHIPLWALIDALDADSVLGGLKVTLPLDERPANDGTPPVSTSRHVRVAPGAYTDSHGVDVWFPGDPAFECPASSISYLFINEATNTLTCNVIWPGVYHVKLAAVTTDATTVTDINDQRWPLASQGPDLATVFLSLDGGTFHDATAAVVVETGPTNGTVFGAVGDKLAFFGGTPAGRGAALTGNDATAYNTGDAATDTALGVLRQRVLDLEARLRAFNLLA